MTSENEYFYFILNTDDSTYSYYKGNDNPYYSLPKRNKHQYENIVLDRPKINLSKLSYENIPPKIKVTPIVYIRQNYRDENFKERRLQYLYDCSYVKCAGNMSPHLISSSTPKTLTNPNIATIGSSKIKKSTRNFGLVSPIQNFPRVSSGLGEACHTDDSSERGICIKCHFIFTINITYLHLHICRILHPYLLTLVGTIPNLSCLPFVIVYRNVCI